MRRWLLAGLISLSLCGALFAQNGSRRLFVGIDGPVKLVRTEIVGLTFEGGKVVEGPRVLTHTQEANEDGTMKVSRHHTRDGAVDFKQVTFFHPDGRARESLVYEDEDRLRTRMLYYYDNGRNRLETLSYDKDGNLISTGVKYLDASLSLIKEETTDKDGNLRARAVAGRDEYGKREETRISYKDGKASSKVVVVVISPRQYEQQYYDANDVLESRVVTIVDHKAEPVEWATYDGQGNLLKKDSFERTYDSRGNWIKQITLTWNPKTGQSRPVQITYRTITYYE